jgi:hypothetical protein
LVGCKLGGGGGGVVFVACIAMKFLVSYAGASRTDAATNIEFNIVPTQPLATQLDSILQQLEQAGAKFSEDMLSANYSLIPHGWVRPLPNSEIKTLIDDLEREGMIDWQMDRWIDG